MDNGANAGEMFNFLIKLIEIILVPALWKIYTLLSKLSDKVNEVRTILIGADGKNGIRSRVRRLENKVEKLALAHAAVNGTISHHEEDTEEE